MPDLESFIANSKNQGDLKSGIKRKKKRKGDDFEEEEVLVKPSGTRSRPAGNKRASANSADDDSMDIEERKSEGRH